MGQGDFKGAEENETYDMDKIQMRINEIWKVQAGNEKVSVFPSATEQPLPS